MLVCFECCVLSGRGLCDELITRPEEPYRLLCVVVCCFRNLKNEVFMNFVWAGAPQGKNYGLILTGLEQIQLNDFTVGHLMTIINANTSFATRSRDSNYIIFIAVMITRICQCVKARFL